MKKLNKFTIHFKDRLDKAIKKININGKRFLIAVDENYKMKGFLSDSDIRRSLLKDINKNSSIEKLLNKRPIYILDNKNREKKINIILKNNKNILDIYSAIPIIDQNKIFKDIFFINNYSKSIKNFVAILMAGGKGLRLGNITKKTPKPLIAFNNQPYIIMLIRKLLNANCNKIFISLHYKQHMFIRIITKEFSNEVKSNIIYFIKEIEPLGTAGSIKKVITKNNEDILIINTDTVFNFNIENLILYHKQNNSFFTVTTKEHTTYVNYGVITTKNNLIKSLKEKPTLNFNIMTGIYFGNHMIKSLIKKSESIDMPELIKRMINKKKKVVAFNLIENIIDFGLKSNLKILKKKFDKYFI